MRAIALSLLALLPALLAAADMPRPALGKPELYPQNQVKPGLKAIAWTVFEGSEPEQVSVEIVGIVKNFLGPQQDLILGKMGGKALRTGVAGGMSGSPVYIDGKLVGAIGYRLSVFSPDAICGITPIQAMLEVNEFDQSRPADTKVPGQSSARAAMAVPGELLARAVGSGAPFADATLVPIDSPLVLSGFNRSTLDNFGGLFRDLGATPVQGGAASSLRGSKPVAGWQNSLRPGEMFESVLVSGDMSMAAGCTVTYNDGKKVLGCGHPVFNMGPVEMPIAKGEVVTVLASSFQPTKIGNATEVVGSLKQDRHSAILGELGAEARMVPVKVKIRSHGAIGTQPKQKDLNFSVFVHQKWTPYLMMVTLFNSLSNMNEFADEATYRIQAKVNLQNLPALDLTTMVAPADLPMPTPMLVAGWWGDKFNRLFSNNIQLPKLSDVEVAVDVLPERRIATIESAYLAVDRAEAGQDVPVKVFLRPYRGERIERTFTIKVPASLPKGDHRILLSDADMLNRLQAAAGQANRFLDLPQTVSLINQERTSNRLYVSLVQPRPTVFADDKTLPNLPASALNVLQSGRTASRPYVSAAETATEQLSIPFDFVVSGSYALKLTVN